MQEGENKFYLDGKKIDKNLPPAYSYGDTLNHKNKQCKNCKFYLETKSGDYCSTWDAEVREEYWCKKWQEE